MSLYHAVKTSVALAAAMLLLITMGCNSGSGSVSDSFVQADPVTTVGSQADPVTTVGPQADPVTTVGPQADPVTTVGPQNDGNSNALDPLVNYISCQKALPCRWSTADSGLSVSVNSVTTDSVTNLITLVLAIETTRDTTIKLLENTTAIDATGRIYSALKPDLINATNLNELTGTVDLLAGITLKVEQKFRELPAPGTRFLERLTLGFIEAGQNHIAGYQQLPLNTDFNDAVDCQNQLPCTWLAENGEFSVSVLLADRFSNNRLETHFKIDAYVNSLIKFDAGSVAIGNDGTNFRSKTHELGENTDFGPITSLINADAAVLGTQNYFRTDSSNVTHLKKVTLNITQADSPGSDIPEFTNVPLN